jgi:hypothetical protein
MRFQLRFCFSIATIALLLGMVGGTQAAFLTTGIYDEPVNLNATDTLATSSNRSIAQFTADMAAAHASDRGGVVNFDTASNDADLATSLVPGDPGRPSYTARFGVSQSKSLIVSRLEYNPVGPFNGMNQNIVNEKISGDGAMGLSGLGAYTLSFSLPLKEWGMTAMSRTGDRTGTMTVTHTDGSTYVFASQNPMGAANANDTLFAYAAPSGKMISQVNWNGPFLRWDDMGFAVPEPCSIALIGIPIVGLLFNRRK